jgi:hypothetical protein
MLRKRSLAGALFGAASVVISCSSFADDHDRDSGPVKLLSTVAVPGAAKMISFDISWVDADTQLYYLADRSNASVDVVDARTGKFVKMIQPQGSQAFAGFHGSNDTAGPNGVQVSGHWLFVSDAPSRVVTIDLRTDQIVGEAFTGGDTGLRADELAYDEEDSVLLVVNNADSPPFATLIKVDRNTGALTVQNKVPFATATNGAEQPVWNPRTGRFYLSIPQIGGNEEDGAVAKIDPHSGAVEAMFPVKFCQPAGLTLGPNQDLLLGCSVVFDTTGQPWTRDATATKPPAAPISVIMDARNGSIDRRVPGVSGSDEVWFNPGDGRYYLAARANAVGPTLGIIGAKTQALEQLVPTVSQAPGSAHSVAVDPRNNHALVPLPANNVVPGCLNGCIGIYGGTRIDY